MTEPSVPEVQPPAVGAAAPADPGDTPAPDPAEGVEAVAPVEAVEPPATHRHPFYLRGRRLRLPSSRRGLFALLLVLGAMGGVAVFSAVSLIHWTETADFCGRCHTMAPELQAYEAGPHKSVACAECHVEPGIAGWVKAKINGTKQLVEVVLGTFPTPIPPPDHSDMPLASDTCETCHGVTRQAVSDLKSATTYSEDEKNTPQFVGLMIRPSGGDPFDVNRSVHWHVLRTVNYWSPDPRAQTIDYVEATQEDGSIAEYIAQNRIKVAENVQPDIDALKAAEIPKTMTCYDCHNRAGHDIANPRAGVDQALTQGAMDKTLPYIKREAMRILWATYPDTAAADAEADKLTSYYELNYPDVAKAQGGADRRRHRRDQGPVPAHRHARHEGHRQDVPEQPGPPGLPGLLPMPRRRPLQGGQRRGDQGDHPVDLRHMPHVPADRARGREHPARGAPGDPQRQPVGVQPQERGHECRPGRPDLRRVSCP